jgi:hypothetical protein
MICEVFQKVILSVKRGCLSFNKGAAVLDAPITVALLTHAPLFLVAQSRRSETVHTHPLLGRVRFRLETTHSLTR